MPKPTIDQDGEDCAADLPQSEQGREQSRLTSWIESIRVPIEATLDVEQSELSDSTVEPRSVFSITSIGTSERPSMIIPRRAKPKRVSQESLRIRGVKCDAPSPDEWSAKFKEFLVEKPVEITFEQTEDLQEIAQDFLKKAGTAQHGENSHEAIEEMCDGISKWKSAMRLAVVTNQEFNADLDRCRGLYTKAVFQRTIMMSIINRSYLKNIFDFNCGGDWSLQGVHPLPSTGGPNDIIRGPKPDLTLFFRFDALIEAGLKRASIPEELRSCMNPDDHSGRCFPFIFIEARKESESIEPAVLANMHSASQALFNIYTWMHKAGHDEIFFRDVRLFSIAIDAEKFVARAHRAVLVDTGDEPILGFLYDDLHKMKGPYTRDEVYTPIQNILSGYAELKLLGILKATVEKVLKEYKQDLKRKYDAAVLNRPAKRIFAGYTEPES